MDNSAKEMVQGSGPSQDYEVVKELGDCHAAVGQYDHAQACYDRAAALGPDEAGPYVGSGVVELQNGNLDAAETAFRVACRLDPGCSKAWCGLAMISQQRDDHAAASDLYLKSLELDKDNLTALLGLFQLSCRTGTFEKLIHHLDVYLDMHPGDISVMFCLATMHLKDGGWGKAKTILNNIVTLDGQNTDAANLLEEVEHVLSQQKIKETRV
ncbi:MAG: tetratricopeptide repeat protein [Planctomycetes bacterium]|nr:tetratricopeptide repeat protein [Planctomycetota bacterium]